MFAIDVPKGIRSVDDLLRDDLRVAVGNPGAASIGKATRRGVGGRWEELADKIAVMDEGRVRQLDTPANIWGAPADRSVAMSFGEPVLLPGTRSADRIKTPFGTAPAPPRRARR